MAKSDKKQPWFKFYPSDWRGDAKLRMCSIGARGLWAEMMCVMHEAEPYGHLVTDGKSITNRQIASLAGVPAAECGRYLAELESAGVYSRTDAGVIFSRRMVRDKAKAETDRNNGKGGGNPQITGSVNDVVNPPDKAQKPETRPSETISKNGESSLSIGNDSGGLKDAPTAIGVTYQPSDASIEYAFSLGMKKSELDEELQKFIRHCEGLRVVSFNPDGNFKTWCDRWLAYQRKNSIKANVAAITQPVEMTPQGWDEAVKRWLKNESSWPRHAGNSPTGGGSRCPAAILLANGVDPESGMKTTGLEFIVAGTPQMDALISYHKEQRRRPPQIFEIENDGRVQAGCYSKWKIAPGYDEQTGEKLSAAGEANVA